MRKPSAHATIACLGIAVLSVPVLNIAPGTRAIGRSQSQRHLWLRAQTKLA
jgi:hypothetical protein